MLRSMRHNLASSVSSVRAQHASRGAVTAKVFVHYRRRAALAAVTAARPVKPVRKPVSATMAPTRSPATQVKDFCLAPSRSAPV